MAIPQGECGAQEPRSLEGSAGVEAENVAAILAGQASPGFLSFFKITAI